MALYTERLHTRPTRSRPHALMHNPCREQGQHKARWQAATHRMRQNWATRREGSAAARTQSRGYQAHMPPPATLQLPGTTAGRMVYRQLCAPHAAPAHAAEHSPFIDGLPLKEAGASSIVQCLQGSGHLPRAPNPTLSTPAQRPEDDSRTNCQQCPLSKQQNGLAGQQAQPQRSGHFIALPTPPTCLQSSVPKVHQTSSSKGSHLQPPCSTSPPSITVAASACTHHW